jgi:hypothetical protein
MKLNRISLFLLFLIVPSFAVNISAQMGKVSAATQNAIVQQLVGDRGITADCVREAGGASKVVSIKPLDLNRDGKPEFIVYGESGCAFGANSPYGWVYRKSANGYEMLLDAGPNQEISRKKTLTKGYYDLRVLTLGPETTTYKFNGTRYQ